MDLKKLLAQLPPDFAHDVNAMSDVQIDDKVVECEEHVYEVQKAMEADDELKAAREHVRELTKSYTDVIKQERAKISYCLHRKEEMGKL